MKSSLQLVLLVLLFAVSGSAQNPAAVPVPRNPQTAPAWISRHEGMLEEAKKGGIDLLFLGDSITDNWRSRGLAVWEKYYASRHGANFGIGGDRTQHLLWRIEHGELDGLKPKVIVLMIGTNNSNSDSADQITEGIEQLVAVVRTKCPESNLLLLAIFPRNKPVDKPAQMETIRQVNNSITRLDNGKTIRFLNINDEFLGPDGKVTEDVMPDLLHPNERGYQIWAAAMEPTLAKMFKGTTTKRG